MERIPFDIKYRSEIEAGKYCVVTRAGDSVRIVCWDRTPPFPSIIALAKSDSFEGIIECYNGGKCDIHGPSRDDLFLVPNPDYKEPETEPSVTAEPSEAAVLATMSALKAEFTNYEHSYQCRVKMRVNLVTIAEVWGQGETPYKAALEVYKQLMRGAVDKEVEEGGAHLQRSIECTE